MSRVLDMQIVMPRADALRWVYSLFLASLAVFTGFFLQRLSDGVLFSTFIYHQ